MGAELAIAVTVAAIFLVPTTLDRKGGGWPSGDLGRLLDVALVVALVLMTLFVARSYLG